MSCNAAAAAAILAGDAAKLAPLISSIDLNGSIPETGQPLLHSAVLAESLSCVGLLLQAGISARLVNGDGESALVPAINRRQYRIAHTLLAAGADMRAADKFGYSLLNNAITARDLPAIVLFLEFGLTIDELHNARFNFPSFDSDKNTLLAIAARDNRPEVLVKLLQVKQIDINKQNSNGETALALACAAGHHVCVRLLLKARAELMATARNGMNAFLFAAQSGSVECLTACLQSYHDQSAMLKSQTLSGESALHLAAKCANPAAIQCLLQSGPAIRSMINLTDIQGQMPAHVAARSDRPESLQFLLAAGADIKILDRTGSNIVLTAAQHGCASSLAALVLDRDTVVTTSNNRTATSFSIRGNKGMCFLNAGLKVSIKREDSNEVIEQEDRNCTPLLESASRHHTECVAVLLAAGAKMEQSDSNGRTPLILAAAGGFDDIVSLLLMKKASVNHVDLSGATALFHACSKKHVSCIELLLRHGCDINIADASHRRPVDLIVKHKMVEVLTKLVNAGAEIKQHWEFVHTHINVRELLHLNFAHGNWSSLPPTLTKCTQLNRLVLSRNQFTSKSLESEMSSVPISTSSTPSTPTTASPNYTPTATAALNGTNIYAAPTVNQSHSTPDCDAIDRPSGAFAKYFSSAPAITTSSSSSSTAIAFKNRLTSSQPASAPERPALTPFAFKQATLPSVQLIDTKSNSANAPHAIKINASPVSPVPAHLFAFLTELDLSHNMLDSCPATLLLHCPRLQRLNLSHNQFRILEHSNHLAQAKFLSLIAFDASHNPHLKQCSADFFAVFPKLQHLTLSHCAFTEFSPSLLGFNKEMKIIDLNANPMLSAQPAAFKPGSKKSSELVTDPKLKESKNGDDCVIS